ncbi:MAG: hypothetical protein ISS31_10880 [Kiritimatiellae bacterium]|nr:hypothetical protein [Kiritimatiellia bacterium]
MCELRKTLAERAPLQATFNGPRLTAIVAALNQLSGSTVGGSTGLDTLKATLRWRSVKGLASCEGC